MFIQKIQKISITIFSLLLLSAMATGTVSAKTSTKTIDYVALGDSLAAGQKPTLIGSDSAKLYGSSYPKFIRDELAGQGLLSSYANFGVSGYQTGQVLLDVMTPGVTQEAIRNAEIITLDIGANDLLSLPQLQAEEGDVSQLLDNLAYMTQDQIDYLIYQMESLRSSMVLPYVASQVGTIVMEIKELNPDAKIYVMGYYDAFSFLADYSDDPVLQGKINSLLPVLTGLIQTYNATLQQTLGVMFSENQGITYVATWDAMDLDSNARAYLPLDIHPTVQGYRAIAQAFWGEMDSVVISE